MSAETKKRSKNKGPVIAALLLIVIAAGVLLVQRYMPSGTWMDQSGYFGTLGEQEAAVVLQDHVAEERALLVDSAVYLDYDLVQSAVNSRFYWDSERSIMLYTTALETYEIPLGSLDYTIDGAKNSYDRAIVLQQGDRLYFSIDFLQQYTNMEYTLVDVASAKNEKHADQILPHVLVKYQWGTQTTGTVKKKTAVRYQGGIKSEILTEAMKDDTVTILEELEDWYKVLTPDGYVGYVQKNRLKDVAETEVTRAFQEPEYSSLTKAEQVSLVWHQIDNSDANAYLSEDTADMTGVNVISPTWYSVADNSGTITSLASQDYVKKAHDAGLEVWALISNFSADVDTSVLLSSTEARRTMVDFLVSDALNLGIEGINLDFEYITEAAGYSYVQFVRELSIACRKNNLVFSIDVPVPMEFNQYFNRKELGTVADYLIIMGYDEHYVGSEAAGSVASISFEQNGITGTLESVSANKIISGVPFYTRIWYTADNGDGTTSVTSEAIGMNTAEKTLDTYGVTPVWDEETQQDYASWTTDDGVLCEIWLENETSLAKKAALVKEYKLGGIAAWVLGFERASIWNVLSENIK